MNPRRLTMTALCIALCVVLPMAFHSIQGAGSIFLPMHIPVLLCGLACGPVYGLVCGLAGPFLSSLLTDMPPAPYLPSMLIELGVYGLATGLLILVIRTKWPLLNLYLSLLASLLVGRIVGGIVQAFIFQAGKYTWSLWFTSYFAKGLPGIAIQLLLIPALVLALQKAKLIRRV